MDTRSCTPRLGPRILFSALLLVPVARAARVIHGDVFVNLGAPNVPFPGREILIQSFSPGYVILSVILAVVGATCTLELLVRRTSNRGTWNISLLVGAAFAFGSVSCFALHFVGNQALTLHRPVSTRHPHPRALTLAYDAGFTILSLVVSVAVSVCAFAVMGLDLEGLEWYGRRKTGELQRRKGSTATVNTKAGDDGTKQRKKWKRGAGESGLSRTKRVKESKVWRTLGGAMAWTMVDLGERASRPAFHLTGLPADKSQAYAAEERERGVGLGAGADFGSSTGEPNSAGRNRRSSGRLKEAEEGFGLELSPRSRGTNPALPSTPLDPDAFVVDSSSSNLQRRASAPTIHPLPSALFSPAFSLAPATSSLVPPSRPTPSRHSSLDTVPLQSDSASSSIPLPSFPSTSAGSNSALLPPRRPSASSLPRIPPHGASVSRLHRASISHIPSSPGRRPSLLPLHDGPSSPIAYPASTRRTSSIPTFSVPLTRSIGRINSGEMTFEEFEASENGQREWIRGSFSTSQGTPSERRRPSYLGLGDNGAGGHAMEKDDSRGWASSNAESSGKESGGGERVRDFFPHHLGKDDAASEYAEKEQHSTARKGKSSPLRRGMGFVLGDVTKAEVWKVCSAGIVAGWGICGMHYIGQRSISSIPYISYSPFLVVLSVVIACLAVTIALWTMFIVLKPKLAHSWIKKFGVACVLGSGTSLMHYTAMLGTTYLVDMNIDLPNSAHQGQTRTIITALVSCLAVLACLALLISVIIAQRRLRTHRSRRRRVVLATAIWDESTGHVLVSPDGMLPLTDIGALETSDTAVGLKSGDRASAFVDSSSVTSSVLDIDLIPSHPAFVASLRSTWFWRQAGAPPPTLQQDRQAPPDSSTASQELEPADDPRIGTSFDLHALRRGSNADGLYPGSASLAGHSGTTDGSVSRFLDRFSAACATLAVEVTGGVEGTRRLGVLYDRILTTGFITFYTNSSARRQSQRDTVSKGQMIFLSNSCTPGERSFYTRRGFTFAAPNAVAKVMASTLAIPVADMASFMTEIHSFATVQSKSVVRPAKLYSGVYLAQALPFVGLRVVVDSEVRHSLPMREFGDVPRTGHVRLSSDRGDGDELVGSLEELGEIVASLAGESLLSMMDPNQHRNQTSDSSPTTVSRVRTAIVDAVVPLLDRVPRSVMREVLRDLVILPSIIPLTPPSSHSHEPLRPHSTVPDPSYLIVFKAILPSTTDFSDLGSAWTWQSFRLFRAQNESVARDALAEAALEGRMDSMDLATASNLAVSKPSMEVVQRVSRVQWGPISSSRDPSPRLMTVLQSSPTETDTEPFSFQGYSFPVESFSPTSPSPTSTTYAPPNSSFQDLSSDEPPSSHLPSHTFPTRRRPADLVFPPAHSHPLHSIYAPPSASSDDSEPFQPVGIRAYDPMWLVHVIREGEMVAR